MTPKAPAPPKSSASTKSAAEAVHIVLVPNRFQRRRCRGARGCRCQCSARPGQPGRRGKLAANALSLALMASDTPLAPPRLSTTPRTVSMTSSVSRRPLGNCTGFEKSIVTIGGQGARDVGRREVAERTRRPACPEAASVSAATRRAIDRARDSSPGAGSRKRRRRRATVEVRPRGRRNSAVFGWTRQARPVVVVETHTLMSATTFNVGAGPPPSWAIGTSMITE